MKILLEEKPVMVELGEYQPGTFKCYNSTWIFFFVGKTCLRIFFSHIYKGVMIMSFQSAFEIYIVGFRQTYNLSLNCSNFNLCREMKDTDKGLRLQSIFQLR